MDLDEESSLIFLHLFANWFISIAAIEKNKYLASLPLDPEDAENLHSSHRLKTNLASRLVEHFYMFLFLYFQELSRSHVF